MAKTLAAIASEPDIILHRQFTMEFLLVIRILRYFETLTLGQFMMALLFFAQSPQGFSSECAMKSIRTFSDSTSRHMCAREEVSTNRGGSWPEVDSYMRAPAYACQRDTIGRTWNPCVVS
jgi:hypothetical protein